MLLFEHRLATPNIEWVMNKYFFAVSLFWGIQNHWMIFLGVLNQILELDF